MTAASVRVTFDVVLGALQPLTYAPELASLMPEMLALAARGDYAPLVAASLLFDRQPRRADERGAALSR